MDLLFVRDNPKAYIIPAIEYFNKWSY